MTWTKLTDTFADDPRLLRLPPALRYLHVEGLIWCNRHGTDGHIPVYALRRVTDQEDPEVGVALIVETGLWEVEDGGWLIVVFFPDQPRSADEAGRKAGARFRQERRRRHLRDDHDLCDPERCRVLLSRVTPDVSPAVSSGATNALPSRPDLKGGTRRERDRARRRARSAPPRETPHAPQRTSPKLHRPKSPTPTRTPTPLHLARSSPWAAETAPTSRSSSHDR